MAKHRLFNAKGKPHTKILCVGPLIVAARVKVEGVWVSAASLYEQRDVR
jgi:hypothetical protein